jgi:ankyrin repeat protein
MGASPSTVQQERNSVAEDAVTIRSAGIDDLNADGKTLRKISASDVGETVGVETAEIHSKLSKNTGKRVSFVVNQKQFLGDDNIPYSRHVEYAWQCPKGHTLVPVNIRPSVGVAPLERASSPSGFPDSVPKKKSLATKSTNQAPKLDMDPLQLKIRTPDAKQKSGIHQSELLRTACADGDLDLVAKLLVQGADVNHQSIKGVTPLHSCVFAANFKLAKLLINHGADHMMSDENEMAPIHYAAAEGALELVRLFVECAGTSIAGLVGVQGITPAHMAANMGQGDVLLYISEICGPEFCDQLDCQGNSPLHLASSCGHTDCVDILLHMGCSTNVRNSNRMTPLMVALNPKDVNQTLSVVRLLLPLTDVLESDEVAIPPELFGDDDFGSSLAIDTSIDDVQIEHATNLHAAILSGSISKLRMLLFAGAKLDTYDGNGFTPFHYACSKNRLDMVALMLNFGDTVKLATSLLKTETISPLICAISANSCALVQYLVGKFPSWLEVRDSEGVAPVAVALHNHCSIALVRALVIGGADLKAVAKIPEKAFATNLHVALNWQTISVYEYASKFHDEAAQFIRIAGVDPVTMKTKWCNAITKYVDVWNRCECALIHRSAFLGKVSEVQEFLKKRDPLIDSKDAAGFTALHAACAGGFLQVVNLLLEANYKLDVTDNDAGLSPLIFAVNGGFPTLVERLLPMVLDASSLYDAQEHSLLSFLPADENEAIVISSAILSVFPFIEEGTIENANVTAHIARIRANVQSTVLFITNADCASLTDLLARLPLLIYCRMSFEGQTLLHMACERLESTMCVELLCNIGAPVEAVMSNGLSPLHVAALYKNLAAMNILLSFGASPDLPDQNGWTPLHIVAIESYSDGVKLLVQDWHAESMNADFHIESCCSSRPTKIDRTVTIESSENAKLKCHVCLASASQSESGWFTCSVENCCDCYAVCLSCMDILQANERPNSPVFTKFLENSRHGRASPNLAMSSTESSKFGPLFDKKVRVRSYITLATVA